MGENFLFFTEFVISLVCSPPLALSPSPSTLSLSVSDIFFLEGEILSATDQLGPDQHPQSCPDRVKEGLQKASKPGGGHHHALRAQRSWHDSCIRLRCDEHDVTNRHGFHPHVMMFSCLVPFLYPPLLLYFLLYSTLLILWCFTLLIMHVDYSPDSALSYFKLIIFNSLILSLLIICGLWERKNILVSRFIFSPFYYVLSFLALPF